MSGASTVSPALDTSFGNEVGVFVERDVQRSLDPESIVNVVVQPLVFYGIFYATFSQMIESRGVDFGRWVTPTIVVQALMFVAIGSAMTIAGDRASGLFSRLRTMPVSSAALGAARGVLVVAEAVVATAVITLVGHLAGFRFGNGVPAAIGFFAVAVLFAFALAAMTATLGLVIKNQEALSAALYLPYLPLLVLSTGFVPLDLFPDWIQPVVEVSPVSAVIEALRFLSAGDDGGGAASAADVGLAVAWCVGLFAVFTWLTMRAFRRSEQ